MRLPADKEDDPSLGRDVSEEVECASEEGRSLVKIKDATVEAPERNRIKDFDSLLALISFHSLSDDEWSHCWAQCPRRVSQVHPGVEQVLHGEQLVHSKEVWVVQRV